MNKLLDINDQSLLEMVSDLLKWKNFPQPLRRFDSLRMIRIWICLPSCEFIPGTLRRWNKNKAKGGGGLCPGDHWILDFVGFV